MDGQVNKMDSDPAPYMFKVMYHSGQSNGKLGMLIAFREPHGHPCQQTSLLQERKEGMWRTGNLVMRIKIFTISKLVN